MGLVEELGSGVRKIFKYTPIYSDGKLPVIEEDDIYRIVVPYTDKVAGKETGKENMLISSPVQELLHILGEKELSVKEMMKLLNLKGSDLFRKSYLNPAISAQFVEMTHPENPKHRNQKYRVRK